MRIIALDNEKNLQSMKSVLDQIAAEFEEEWEERIPYSFEGFSDPVQALNHALKPTIDVAFVNPQMQGLNVLDFVKKLQRWNPYINVIFVMDELDGMFLIDSYPKIRFSGFIQTPLTVDNVGEELDDLRYPIKI